MNYCYPLTYAQKRLCFEYKLSPNCIKYNLPLLFKLKGKLNVESLREAWGKVVQRHASLRTHFTEENKLCVKLKGDPRDNCLFFNPTQELCLQGTVVYEISLYIQTLL